MTLPEIKNKLINLEERDYPYQKLIDQLEALKVDFVKSNLQNEAKECWIYQTVLKIHNCHNSVFTLLEDKQYYEAWCELERNEIRINNIKCHTDLTSDPYYLKSIEKWTKNLQSIYPYSIFASTEILELEKQCSICKNIISIRNNCGHKLKEIYDGEMCIRIITKSKIIGAALVQDPVHKYSVMFLKNPETEEQEDHYNYGLLQYLINLIESPYQDWNLEISSKYISHSNYSINRNEPCPCQSNMPYQDCCLERKGVLIPHYAFVMDNPSEDKRKLMKSIII